MEKLDKLIKSLQDLKEELEKTANQMYGASTPNMAKDEVRPDRGYGKVTVKDSSPPPPKENPYGKVILKEELTCSENGQWDIVQKDAADPKLAPKDVKVKQLQEQIDSGKYKPDAGKIAGAIVQHPDKPLEKEEE